MQIVGYEFRTGSIFQAGAKADPSTVGHALESLRKQFKGELTPDDVIEAARSRNNPLHDYFEWDDSAAARLHRLAQARSLIRCVVAVYRGGEVDAPYLRVHAFTHVAEGETSHYRDTAHAMSQKSTRDAVIKRAWNELKQWQRRYKDLTEFATLFEAMEEIKDELPKKVIGA